MEYVINKINGEMHDFAQKTVKSVDELTVTTKRHLTDDIVARAQHHHQSNRFS